MKSVLKDTKLGTVVKEHGVTFNVDDGIARILVPSARSAYQLYKSQKSGRKLRGYNEEVVNNALIDSRESGMNQVKFTGATAEDTLKAADGIFDKSLFVETRKKMQASIGTLQTVDKQISRKRSRAVSEHDGEFDFDRQWDRAPFYATRIDNNGVAKSIEIVADFSISAGVDAKQIREYGALVWGVVDTLERNGIQCGVRLLMDTNGNMHAYDESNPHTRRNKLEVVVKNASEYIDPMNLARCFTAAFFRRVMFALQGIISDAAGYEAQMSLGIPNSRRSRATHGEIFFGVDMASGGYTQIKFDQINKMIKTAVFGGDGLKNE